MELLPRIQFIQVVLDFVEYQYFVVEFAVAGDIQSFDFGGLLLLATKRLQIPIIVLLQSLVILLESDVFIHGLPQLILQSFLVLLDAPGS